MPLLVNKLIFRLVPSRAPFFLRPLLWPVFSTLDSAVVNPRLKVQADFVCIFYCTPKSSLKRSSSDRLLHRSKNICQNTESGWLVDRDPHLLTS